MARNALIQVRRDTAANWTSVNPTLASGEQGFETDTGKFKIGTGSTAWNSLLYATDASEITGSFPSLNVQASTGTAMRITNTGTGDSFLVEDSASTDSSPFVINSGGAVGIGTTTVPAGRLLDVVGGTIRTTSAATQDGIALSGNSNGTLNRTLTIFPNALTSNRQLSFPDITGEGAVFLSGRGTNTGWINFTTTVTQSVNVSFGTYVSRYTQIGKMINWQFALLITGTGVTGNAVRIDLPQTAQASATYAIMGQMHIYDASANAHISGIAFAYNTTQAAVIPHFSSNYVGTGTFAIASGDVISGHIIYEAA